MICVQQKLQFYAILISNWKFVTITGYGNFLLHNSIKQQQLFFVPNLTTERDFWEKKRKKNIDERNFQLFTLTIDEITMNFPTIFVTHVELSAHFIKIHGQTNRQTARIVEYSMPTIINMFATFPPPLINMLYVDCMVLVYYNNKYFRGKFISADALKTANILLIDMGFMVTVELANVRHSKMYSLQVTNFFLFSLIDSSFGAVTQSMWIIDQWTGTSKWIHSQSMHHLSR